MHEGQRYHHAVEAPLGDVSEDDLGSIAKVDQATINFVPKSTNANSCESMKARTSSRLRPDIDLESITIGSRPRASTVGMCSSGLLASRPCFPQHVIPCPLASAWANREPSLSSERGVGLLSLPRCSRMPAKKGKIPRRSRLLDRASGIGSIDSCSPYVPKERLRSFSRVAR